MNSYASCEELRGPLVRPKPMRIGRISGDRIRLYGCHRADPRSGEEVLDIFLYEAPPSLPPPFFFGSPPTRSVNPLIRDVQFGEVNANATPADMPEPGSDKKGRTRNFRFAPAPVRVEGFDCRSRRIAGLA